MALSLRRFLAIGVIALGAAPAHALAPLDSWHAISILGSRAGYDHLTVQNIRWKGRPGLRIASQVETRLVLLGAAVTQQINVVELADAAGRPRLEQFSMDSAGHRVFVRAEYSPTAVRVHTSSGGETSYHVIPIPKGKTLVLDPTILPGWKSVPGEKARFDYFDPASGALQQGTVEVLRKEPLSLSGIKYDTTVSRITVPMGTLMLWEGANGDALKMTGPLGITAVHTSKAEALASATDKYAPPADIADAASVKVETPISDPRILRLLRLKVATVAGSDPVHIVQDYRQTVMPLGGGAEEVDINARDADPHRSVPLSQAARGHEALVRPSTFVQSDNPQIVAKAREIVGHETNALWAAMKIRDWVYQNMGVDASIAVPRSALDVFKDRRGVCRDYAILYAGLARAAGIPTRLATGLVYANGAFYYHAWDESFVGQWIDVDTTLPNAFVDATHVKLAHGDFEAMFGAVRDMGSLKAEVLEAR